MFVSLFYITHVRSVRNGRYAFVKRGDPMYRRLIQIKEVNKSKEREVL